MIELLRKDKHKFMKAQKRLNLVLIVLIVLLLSLISFVGVYYQNKNTMVSRIPDYILGTDLTGYRRVTMEIKEDEETSDSTTSTTLDSVSLENTVEENSVAADNSESELQKAEDYEKAANIIRDRLKYLKLDNYTVSIDKSTGKMDLTVPEKDYTDTILSDITQPGHFTIKDTESGDVLMDNKDISSVDVGYSTQSGKTYVVMNVNFTLSGTNKLKDITKTHQNVLVENTVSYTTGDGEEQADGTIVYSGVQETDPTPTYEDKTVTLFIDDTDLMETDFSEIIDNGTLALTLGTSEDAEELTTMLWGARNIGAMLSTDYMPVQYSVSENNYVASTVDSNTIKVLVCVEIAIALAIALVFVLKYRVKGIMQVVLSVGFMAILLLAIRYANVTLSIDGIIALGLAYVIDSVFGFVFLKTFEENKKELTKKEKKNAYKEVMKKYACILVPELIFGFIGALNGWAAIYSSAMCIFWGIIISYVYNAIFAYFVKEI